MERLPLGAGVFKLFHGLRRASSTSPAPRVSLLRSAKDVELVANRLIAVKYSPHQNPTRLIGVLGKMKADLSALAGQLAGVFSGLGNDELGARELTSMSKVLFSFRRAAHASNDGAVFTLRNTLRASVFQCLERGSAFRRISPVATELSEEDVELARAAAYLFVELSPLSDEREQGGAAQTALQSLAALLLERGRWRSLSPVHLASVLGSIGAAPDAWRTPSIAALVHCAPGRLLMLSASRPSVSTSPPLVPAILSPVLVNGVLSSMERYSILNVCWLEAVAHYLHTSLPRGAWSCHELARLASAVANVMMSANGGLWEPGVATFSTAHWMEFSQPSGQTAASEQRGDSPSELEIAALSARTNAAVHSIFRSVVSFVGPELLKLHFNTDAWGRGSADADGARRLVPRPHQDSSMLDGGGWTLSNATVLLRALVVCNGARVHSQFVDQLLAHITQLLQAEIEAGAFSRSHSSRRERLLKGAAYGEAVGSSQAAHFDDAGVDDGNELSVSVSAAVSRVHFALLHLRFVEKIEVDRTVPPALQQFIRGQLSTDLSMMTAFQADVGHALSALTDERCAALAPQFVDVGRRLGAPASEWTVPEIGVAVDFAWPLARIVLECDGPTHDVLVCPQTAVTHAIAALEEGAASAIFAYNQYATRDAFRTASLHQSLVGDPMVTPCLASLGYVPLAKAVLEKRDKLLHELGYTVIRIPVRAWQSRPHASPSDNVLALGSLLADALRMRR